MATRAFRTLDGKVIPFDDQLLDPAALEAMGATLEPSFQIPEQDGELAQAVPQGAGVAGRIEGMPGQQPSGISPERADVAPLSIKPAPTIGKAVASGVAAAQLPPVATGGAGVGAGTLQEEAKKGAADIGEALQEQAERKGQATGERITDAAPQKPRTAAGGGGGQPAKDPLQEEQERILEDAAQLRLDQRLLIQQRQDADMELAKVQVEQQQEMARQAAEEVARAKAMREEIEREADRLQQEVRDTARNASEQRVDPNRYWNSRSNFARAIGALALVIGARNPQGDNVAKKMMDDAIDRDIKEQEFAAEQAWAKNRAAKSQFVDYLETYGSPKAARENLKSVMYAQLAHERQAQLMNAGLDRQAVENDSVFKQLSLEQQQRELMGRQETVNAILQQRMAAANAAAAARKQDDQIPEAGRVVFDKYGGRVGWALPGEDVKALRGEVINFQQMGEWFDEYEALAQTNNAKIPGTPENQRAKSLEGFITAAAQKSVYGTRMTDADQEQWVAAAGDPKKILTTETVKRSKQAVDEMLENVIQGRVRGTPGGAQPAKPPKPRGVQRVE